MPRSDQPSRGPGTQAVERLANFIRARTRLLIRPRNIDIVARVAERRAAVKHLSPESYIDQVILTKDLTEIEQFTIELTVGETHFFRGPPQFDALRNEIVPALYAKKKRTRSISALSAGCATGEEAYSIAIVLRETAPADPWRMEVTGIDINARSLQKAESAVFSAWSLRDVSEVDRRRYFRIEGDSFHLNDDVRRLVRFRRAALTDAALDTLFPTGIDLVVCQNVLYYLENEARNEVVRALAQSLAIGGYLLFGPVDHFDDVPGCKVIHFGEVAVYERTGPVTVSASVSPSVLRRSRWPSAPSCAATAVPGRLQIPASAPVPKDLAADAIAAPTSLTNAFARANAGDIQGALDLLGPLLDDEPEEPKGHLLEGLILTELGSFDAALDAFRRCVYLDPSMMLAHAGAAVACIRLGRHDLVERHASRLRALGRDMSADAPVEGWEGMTVGRLLRMFQETNLSAPRALEVLGR